MKIRSDSLFPRSHILKNCPHFLEDVVAMPMGEF